VQCDLRKMPWPLAQQLKDDALSAAMELLKQAVTSSENRQWEEGGVEEMLLDGASRDAVHPPPRVEGDLGARDGDVNVEVHLLHLERDECGWVEAAVDVGPVGGHVGAVDGARIDDDGVRHGCGAARTERRQPTSGVALACPQ
jgi:hypothetical protein